LAIELNEGCGGVETFDMQRGERDQIVLIVSFKMEDGVADLFDNDGKGP